MSHYHLTGTYVPFIFPPSQPDGGHNAHPQPAPELATVDVTTAHAFCPAAAQSAWADLKEARGQTVRLNDLTPAHAIRSVAGPDDGFVAQADRRRAAVIPIIRAIVAAKGYRGPTLGGAA